MLKPLPLAPISQLYYFAVADVTVFLVVGFLTKKNIADVFVCLCTYACLTQRRFERTISYKARVYAVLFQSNSNKTRNI